jgi:hypothetical protein
MAPKELADPPSRSTPGFWVRALGLALLAGSAGLVSCQALLVL